MRINPVLLSLRLYQFRCHPELTLSLGPGRTHLCGANGRGKTSLLEAIYYLSRLRSFRTHLPRELCAWGQKTFRLEALGAKETLTVTWEEGGRRLQIDGRPAESAEEFWGRLPTVLLAPQDRLLVTGAAALRRQWIDALIAQCHPGYVAVVQRYGRLLAQRNAALRQERCDEKLIGLLAEQMTPGIIEMTRHRADMSGRLAELITAGYESIAGLRQEMAWIYQPDVPAEPEWDRVTENERRQRTTLLGPQRDEWKFSAGGHSLARYGSEGQQRLAAISLRLAEAAIIRDHRGSWPIFLIDDIAPVLDSEKRDRLERALPPEAQILLAIPEEQPLRRSIGDAAWRVGPGQVESL